MATIRQYALAVRDMQWDLAYKLGCDVSLADPQTRILILSQALVTASILRALTQSGAVTDAQLKAVMDTVRQAPLTQEPGMGAGWNITPMPLSGDPITGIGTTEGGAA